MKKTWTPEEIERGDEQFVANGLRLNGRDWLIVGAFGLFIMLFGSRIWETVEPFDPDADYRIPKALKTDYWLFERWTRTAAGECETLVVGDSVIWGEYVEPEGTLTHYLNTLSGERRFANLGVAGLHPTPLAGLVEHYGGGISGKKVILHCNLLWMSSPRHDLREEKEFKFFHSDLAPQFFPRIPCYTLEDEQRLGIVARRYIPSSAWTNHLQIAYFTEPGDSQIKSIPDWTIDNPYRNPLNEVSFRWEKAHTAYEIHRDENEIRKIMPATPEHQPLSWSERGIRPSDLAWVDLESSLQWASFKRTVELLKSRGNSVSVLVGPFNEHLLTHAGRARFAEMKRTVAAWLTEQKIPHLVPDPLPSELYADASHPLAEGYKLLAEQLFQNRMSMLRSPRQ